MSGVLIIILVILFAIVAVVLAKFLIGQKILGKTATKQTGGGQEFDDYLKEILMLLNTWEDQKIKYTVLQTHIDKNIDTKSINEKAILKSLVSVVCVGTDKYVDELAKNVGNAFSDADPMNKYKWVVGLFEITDAGNAANETRANKDKIIDKTKKQIYKSFNVLNPNNQIRTLTASGGFSDYFDEINAKKVLVIVPCYIYRGAINYTVINRMIKIASQYYNHTDDGILKFATNEKNCIDVFPWIVSDPPVGCVVERKHDAVGGTMRFGGADVEMFIINLPITDTLENQIVNMLAATRILKIFKENLQRDEYIFVSALPESDNVSPLDKLQTNPIETWAAAVAHIATKNPSVIVQADIFGAIFGSPSAERLAKTIEYYDDIISSNLVMNAGDKSPTSKDDAKFANDIISNLDKKVISDTFINFIIKFNNDAIDDDHFTTYEKLFDYYDLLMSVKDKRALQKVEILIKYLKGGPYDEKFFGTKNLDGTFKHEALATKLLSEDPAFKHVMKRYKECQQACTNDKSDDYGDALASLISDVKKDVKSFEKKTALFQVLPEGLAEICTKMVKGDFDVFVIDKITADGLNLGIGNFGKKISDPDTEKGFKQACEFLAAISDDTIIYKCGGMKWTDITDDNIEMGKIAHNNSDQYTILIDDGDSEHPKDQAAFLAMLKVYVEKFSMEPIKDLDEKTSIRGLYQASSAIALYKLNNNGDATVVYSKSPISKAYDALDAPKVTPDDSDSDETTEDLSLTPKRAATPTPPWKQGVLEKIIGIDEEAKSATFGDLIDKLFTNGSAAYNPATDAEVYTHYSQMIKEIDNILTSYGNGTDPNISYADEIIADYLTNKKAYLWGEWARQSDGPTTNAKKYAAELQKLDSFTGLKNQCGGYIYDWGSAADNTALMVGFKAILADVYDFESINEKAKYIGLALEAIDNKLFNYIDNIDKKRNDPNSASKNFAYVKSKPAKFIADRYADYSAILVIDLIDTAHLPDALQDNSIYRNIYMTILANEIIPNIADKYVFSICGIKSDDFVKKIKLGFYDNNEIAILLKAHGANIPLSVDDFAAYVNIVVNAKNFAKLTAPYPIAYKPAGANHRHQQIYAFLLNHYAFDGKLYNFDFTPYDITENQIISAGRLVEGNNKVITDAIAVVKSISGGAIATAQHASDLNAIVDFVKNNKLDYLSGKRNSALVAKFPPVQFLADVADYNTNAGTATSDFATAMTKLPLPAASAGMPILPPKASPKTPTVSKTEAEKNIEAYESIMNISKMPKKNKQSATTLLVAIKKFITNNTVQINSAVAAPITDIFENLDFNLDPADWHNFIFLNDNIASKLLSMFLHPEQNDTEYTTLLTKSSISQNIVKAISSLPLYYLINAANENKAEFVKFMLKISILDDLYNIANERAIAATINEIIDAKTYEKIYGWMLVAVAEIEVNTNISTKIKDLTKLLVFLHDKMDMKGEQPFTFWFKCMITIEETKSKTGKKITTIKTPVYPKWGMIKLVSTLYPSFTAKTNSNEEKLLIEILNPMEFPSVFQPTGCAANDTLQKLPELPLIYVDKRALRKQSSLPTTHYGALLDKSLQLFEKLEKEGKVPKIQNLSKWDHSKYIPAKPYIYAKAHEWLQLITAKEDIKKLIEVDLETNHKGIYDNIMADRNYCVAKPQDCKDFYKKLSKLGNFPNIPIFTIAVKILKPLYDDFINLRSDPSFVAIVSEKIKATDLIASLSHALKIAETIDDTKADQLAEFLQNVELVYPEKNKISTEKALDDVDANNVNKYEIWKKIANGDYLSYDNIVVCFNQNLPTMSMFITIQHTNNLDGSKNATKKALVDYQSAKMMRNTSVDKLADKLKTVHKYISDCATTSKTEASLNALEAFNFAGQNFPNFNDLKMKTATKVAEESEMLVVLFGYKEIITMPHTYCNAIPTNHPLDAAFKSCCKYDKEYESWLKAINKSIKIITLKLDAIKNSLDGDSLSDFLNSYVPTITDNSELYNCQSTIIDDANKQSNAGKIEDSDHAELVKMITDKGYEKCLAAKNDSEFRKSLLELAGLDATKVAAFDPTALPVDLDADIKTAVDAAKLAINGAADTPAVNTALNDGNAALDTIATKYKALLELVFGKELEKSVEKLVNMDTYKKSLDDIATARKTAIDEAVKKAAEIAAAAVEAEKKAKDEAAALLNAATDLRKNYEAELAKIATAITAVDAAWTDAGGPKPDFAQTAAEAAEAAEKNARVISLKLIDARKALNDSVGVTRHGATDAASIAEPAIADFDAYTAMAKKHGDTQKAYQMHINMKALYDKDVAEWGNISKNAKYGDISTAEGYLNARKDDFDAAKAPDFAIIASALAFIPAVKTVLDSATFNQAKRNADAIPAATNTYKDFETEYKGFDFATIIAAAQNDYNLLIPVNNANNKTYKSKIDVQIADVDVVIAAAAGADIIIENAFKAALNSFLKLIEDTNTLIALREVQISTINTAINGESEINACKEIIKLEPLATNVMDSWKGITKAHDDYVGKLYVLNATFSTLWDEFTKGAPLSKVERVRTFKNAISEYEGLVKYAIAAEPHINVYKEKKKFFDAAELALVSIYNDVKIEHDDFLAGVGTAKIAMAALSGVYVRDIATPVLEISKIINGEKLRDPYQKTIMAKGLSNVFNEYTNYKTAAPRHITAWNEVEKGAKLLGCVNLEAFSQNMIANTTALINAIEASLIPAGNYEKTRELIATANADSAAFDNDITDHNNKISNILYGLNIVDSLEEARRLLEEEENDRRYSEESRRLEEESRRRYEEEMSSESYSRMLEEQFSQDIATAIELSLRFEAPEEEVRAETIICEKIAEITGDDSYHVAGRISSEAATASAELQEKIATFLISQGITLPPSANKTEIFRAIGEYSKKTGRRLINRADLQDLSNAVLRYK